jgi:putative flippase GtrA
MGIGKYAALPRRLWEKVFFRFLVVGVVNTAFGYGVFGLLVLCSVRYQIALAFATVAGVLFNFTTTGAIVFRVKDPWRVFRFVGVYLVVYLVNTQALGFLVRARAGECLYAFPGVLSMPPPGRVNELLGQAVALPAMVVLAFILNKVFVFREAGKKGRPGAERES